MSVSPAAATRSGPRSKEVTMAAPMTERNRYADLLRVWAISMVVIGHWLLTDITYRGGQLSGLDSLEHISWGQWVTLVFQVMPVFFVVGGYVNARSWAAHEERGEAWADWVRERAMRLLWPAAVYVVVADAQPYHDRFACDLCQPEQRSAIGSGEAPCH
jgi:peptidoglycan/LPS O-acetylase OafA/YrhL